MECDIVQYKALVLVFTFYSSYIHVHTRTFVKHLLTKRIQSGIGNGKTEEKRQEP